MSKIMPRITRRLALPGLVYFVICLCSCATGPSDGLIMPSLFEDGWEIAHSWETPTQRHTEFLRSAQTVENWTEMITVQAFNKAYGLVSVDDQVVGFRNTLDEECPGSTVEVIRHTPDGVIFESRTVNCEQGADEHQLVRILEGTSTRFIVHHAVRGAMTPERRAEWLEEMMEYSITVFQ